MTAGLFLLEIKSSNSASGSAEAIFKTTVVFAGAGKSWWVSAGAHMWPRGTCFWCRVRIKCNCTSTAVGGSGAIVSVHREDQFYCAGFFCEEHVPTPAQQQIWSLINQPYIWQKCCSQGEFDVQPSKIMIKQTLNRPLSTGSHIFCPE